MLGAAILRLAKQLLGVLPDHAAPEGEVVLRVPRLVAGWLEDAYREDLVQPAGVADLAGAATMQRERSLAGRSVEPQSQRADSEVRPPAGRVARVADEGAKALLGDLAELRRG